MSSCPIWMSTRSSSPRTTSGRTAGATVRHYPDRPRAGRSLRGLEVLVTMVITMAVAVPLTLMTSHASAAGKSSRPPASSQAKASCLLRVCHPLDGPSGRLEGPPGGVTAPPGRPPGHQGPTGRTAPGQPGRHRSPPGRSRPERPDPAGPSRRVPGRPVAPTEGGPGRPSPDLREPRHRPAPESPAPDSSVRPLRLTMAPRVAPRALPGPTMARRRASPGPLPRRRMASSTPPWPSADPGTPTSA